MKLTALVISLLLVPVAALAADPISVQVDQPIAQGAYVVGVGSKVSISLPGQSQSHPGMFLGKVTARDGGTDSFMFWDEMAGQIDYVPAALVKIADDSLQSIFKLYDQEGGTCTAYAIDDFMEQLSLTGFVGTGALAQTLSTEQGRTQLLVDAVSQYYLSLSIAIRRSVSSMGSERNLDSNARRRHLKTPNRFGSFCWISSRQDIRWPWVLISARTCSMRRFRSSITQILPSLSIIGCGFRGRSAESSGGHTVVAVASFIANGKLELLMLDSDWDAPRVWDFDSVFVPKTAYSEIEFDICDSATGK